MPNLRVVEVKVFVPAKDFELSKPFYRDIGFTLASDGDGVAYFHHEDASFLLQDYFTEELGKNFMMHLLVEDVDAWHKTHRRRGHRRQVRSQAGRHRAPALANARFRPI